MSEKAWYIISTQGIGSRGALLVQSLLDRLEYPGLIWTPTIKVKVMKYGKEVYDNRSLFSGYVFLNTEIVDSKLEQALIEAKIGKFLKLPGATMPTPIKPEEIDHIKSLEEINAEPVPEEIIVVEVGDLVEVCVGPFMGIKGFITAIKGHTVSVDTLVFGRSAPVSFNIAHLSKLTETSSNEETKATEA